VAVVHTSYGLWTLASATWILRAEAAYLSGRWIGRGGVESSAFDGHDRSHGGESAMGSLTDCQKPILAGSLPGPGK
jgi:hypothetical protein